MKIIMKRIQRGIQVSIKADLKGLNLKPHLFLRDDWTTKRVADSNLIILSLSILQKERKKKEEEGEMQVLPAHDESDHFTLFFVNKKIVTSFVKSSVFSSHHQSVYLPIHFV